MKNIIIFIERNLVILLLLPLVRLPFALHGNVAQQQAPTAVSTEVRLKPEIQSLADFQGKLTCKGVFPSNGKSIESQIAFAPDLEGAWLAVRHDDLPPNQFHAAEYWGFDSAAKQFVAFIYDNFGGVRKFTSAGWADNTLIWLGETSKTDPPATQRFVYKRDQASQFVVNWEVKRGSDVWKIGDTLTCKK